MTNPTPIAAFIPASIILRCLSMWKKFKCIPQLYIGLKLSSIKCLEPSHIEKISSKFDIEEGFIVQEVSEGSNAEKVGIKIGDIITCWNEKKISTNIDLDNLLLGICEDHLDRGNSIGSTVVVTDGIFRIRKETHCTKQLTVLVSDDVEVVARGSYPVSAREGPSSLESSDNEVPGQEMPHAPGNTEVMEN
ncbi:hypothetical protein QOZ80_5AG0405040 [Eleusine coracana subsp. coracana]|nr:hypothetical protein QOZ80_5AG0405040 [Eleusine coracana subsp. coracana]